MRIAYIADMRLPTEKAHGLQVVENCAALAAAGADVTLVVPRRFNTPPLAAASPWDYYDVPRTFRVVRLPCLDLFPLGKAFEPVAARLESITFTLAVLIWGRRQRGTVFYSRHELPLVVLSWLFHRDQLAYEAHQRLASRTGAWLQQRCAAACGTVVAVTSSLARHLGSSEALVLRDGFSTRRFADAPSRADARRQLGLPDRAVLVGYVGRLSTMGMSKGVSELIAAVQQLEMPEVHLCLVGGPAHEAEQLQREWQRAGLDASRLHLAGDVPASAVPSYLAAFDVCAVPLPWTPHFAHDASPLKLFEYLAAGRAVLATQLPSMQEVVTHGDNGWLVPAGDLAALAGGLRRLCEDRSLREQLEAGARRTAAQFSWDIRARAILNRLADVAQRRPGAA